MANTFFSGRIPQELNDHATEFARTSGKSKTDLLIEALAQYTGFTLTSNVEDPKPLSLYQLISQLQQQIYKFQETLDTHTQEIKAIKNKFTIEAGTPILSEQIFINNSTDNIDNIVINNENSVIASDQTDTEFIDNTTDNVDNVVTDTVNRVTDHEQNNTRSTVITNNNDDNAVIEKLELTQLSDYRWQPTNESAMSKLLDISRGTLQKHREKIVSGELTPNDTIEGFIDGIACLIKFCGESGEGEQKKRRMWQAFPKKKNSIPLVFKR